MTEEITIGTRLFAVYPYRKNTDASEFEVIGETRKSWIVGAISSRDGTISSNIIYKVAKDTMRERGSKYLPLQFYTHREWQLQRYRNALTRELSNVIGLGGGLRHRRTDQIEAACEALMIDTKTLREKHLGTNGAN